MSHQDRKSQQQIVVNHQVLREVIAWLFPSALFAAMHVRQGSTWKPRLLRMKTMSSTTCGTRRPPNQPVPNATAIHQRRRNRPTFSQSTCRRHPVKTG